MADDAERATLHVRDLAMVDAFTIDNALGGGPTVPAMVSYRVRWSGDDDDRVRIRDVEEDFVGRFILTRARMAWTASNADGFSFTSDPASTSTSPIAYLGPERNGRFFG